jgi:hypothetical protein
MVLDFRGRLLFSCLWTPRLATPTTLPNGTLTFAPGETTSTITPSPCPLPLGGDTNREAGETFWHDL